MRSAGPASCVRSARVSARVSRSPRSPTASSRPAAPHCCSRNVEGSAYPVLTNQFGTQRRMAMALRRANGSTTSRPRVRRAARRALAAVAGRGLSRLFSLGTFAAAIPKTVTAAPVQEVVDDVARSRRAAHLADVARRRGTLHHAPPRLHERSANGRTKRGHVSHPGLRRANVRDALATAQARPRAKPQNGGGACPSPSRSAPTRSSPTPRRRRCRRSSTRWRSRGSCADARCGWCAARPSTCGCRPMLSSCWRATSTTTICASRGRLAITPACTVPADLFPTFHVECITRRRRPIYAATLVGKPPMEDAWLAKATERIFLPLLQMVVPEIVDYNLPVEGGFHNLAIVSIQKSYPGQGKKVMNALWGLGHMMMLTRCIIVVDADVDVQDVRSVAWFALNNVDPSRDLVVMPGPVDDLDHSSFRARRARPQARRRRDAQRRGRRLRARVAADDLVMDAATRAQVTRRWGEYGLDELAAGRGRMVGPRPLTPSPRCCAERGRRHDRDPRRPALPDRHPRRAHAVRAAVCVRRRRPRGARRSDARAALLDHARRHRCAHGRDGGQPLLRSRDRRTQSAHRAAADSPAARCHRGSC